MPPSSQARAPSARLILSIQYFLYFGAMGVYLPYFNLYLNRIGLSKEQIGILSSSRPVLLMIFPLLWGLLADRRQIRRALYLVFTAVSAFFFAGYLFFTGFPALMAVTALHSIFYSPVISFLETFSMALLGKEKRRYGQVRMWGSMAFIAVSLAVGKMVEVWAIESILVMILAGSVLLAGFSFLMPKKAAGQSVLPSKSGPLFTGPMWVFLAAAFLMLLSHGTYYGFYSIHLEELGYSGGFIGATWALASVAEMGVMLNSRRILDRFAPKTVLLTAFVAAVVRWLIMGASGSVPAILAGQILHAATYGAFHVASILYVDQLSPEKNKTLGQAVNNAVTYGLGLVVGFLINGYLYDRVGPFSLFTYSAACAGAGGFLLGVSTLFFRPDKGGELPPPNSGEIRRQ